VTPELLRRLRRALARLAFYEAKYTRGAEALQAPFFLFIFYCVGIYPIAPNPGWAVSILGIAAVATAIRAVAPDRVMLTEQITWIVIASVLCGIELYAITQDGQVHAEKETENREMDAIMRRAERRSFQKLLDSGRQLLSQEEHTSRLAEQSLENIIGADSYAWITPQIADVSLKSPVPLAIHNYGSRILTGVVVRMLDLEGVQCRSLRLSQGLRGVIPWTEDRGGHAIRGAN
jgi:hypothetical protein